MAGTTSCIPALFRRRAARLQSKLSDTHIKQQKEVDSLTTKSGGETTGNNFLMFMELRKKIMTFRDIFDIPPINGSIPIHELLILTREDLHRMYPEFIHIPTTKMKERNTHEGLICFYQVLKCVGDSNWIEDPKVRDKFKHGDVEKVPLDELAKTVVTILDCINRTAKGRFESMEEDEPKKECSSRSSSVSNANSTSSSQCISIDKKSIEQGSEWRYSSCASPHTPTSVLPESPRFGEQNNYSPPRLWDLRAQALEKLSPMDWKRLSFQMVLQKNLQNQNNKIIDPTPNSIYNSDDKDEIQSKLKLKFDDQDKLIISSPSHDQLEAQSIISTTPPSLSPPPTPMSSFPPIKQLHSPPPHPPPPPPPQSTLIPAPSVPSTTLDLKPSSPLPLPQSVSDTTPLPSSPNNIMPPPPLPNAIPIPPPPPPNRSTITPTPPKSTSSTSANTPPSPPPPPSPSLKVPPPPPLPLSPTAKDPTPPPPNAKAPPPPTPPTTLSVGTLPPPSPSLGARDTPPPQPSGATPPPPPPPIGAKGGSAPPPPPISNKGGPGPPPPPPGGARSIRTKNTTKLKRSSHMGNLYRLLRGKVEGSCLSGKTSSQGKKGGGSSNTGAGGGQSMADALAEMTKRSTYFQQIEEDIEKHGKSIKEMQGALSSFQNKDMDELLQFYQQVESKLEVLTDESQIFARFEGFPVKKLEALRMAAALYKKLDAILAELHNWKIESPLAQLLDKVEKYFNKIKGELEALERTKDEDAKKFQSHKIQFDFQILVKIKEAMVDVSSSCMELALKERREAKAETNDQNWSKSGGQKKVCAKMLWKAFQFAFKVYSFAGGQDERADSLTRELAKEIETDPMQD